jgi:hypothetical protein
VRFGEAFVLFVVIGYMCCPSFSILETEYGHNDLKVLLDLHICILLLHVNLYYT